MSSEKKRCSSKRSNTQQKKLKAKHEYLILSDDESEEDGMKRKQLKNCYPKNLVQSSQPVLGTPLRKKLHSILANWKPPLKQTNVAENSCNIKKANNEIKKSQCMDKNVRGAKNGAKSKENEKPFDICVTNSKDSLCEKEPYEHIVGQISTPTPSVRVTQKEIQDETAEQNLCSGKVGGSSEMIDSSKLENEMVSLQSKMDFAHKNHENKLTPLHGNLKASHKSFPSVGSEKFNNEFQEKIALLHSCTDSIKIIHDEISSTPLQTEIETSAIANISQNSLDNKIASLQTISKTSQETLPTKSNLLLKSQELLENFDKCEVLQSELKETTKLYDKSELQFSEPERFEKTTERKSYKNILPENESNCNEEEERFSTTDSNKSFKNLTENCHIEKHSGENQKNIDQQCHQQTNELDTMSQSVCKFKAIVRNEIIDLNKPNSDPRLWLDSPENTKTKNCVIINDDCVIINDDCVIINDDCVIINDDCVIINEQLEQATPIKNKNLQKVSFLNKEEDLPSVSKKHDDVLDKSKQQNNENLKVTEYDTKELKREAFDKLIGEHLEGNISFTSEIQSEMNEVPSDIPQLNLRQSIVNTSRRHSQNNLPVNEKIVKNSTEISEATHNEQDRNESVNGSSTKLSQNYSHHKTISDNTIPKFSGNEQVELLEEKLTGNKPKIENKDTEQLLHKKIQNRLLPESSKTCIPTFNEVLSLEQKTIELKDSTVKSFEKAHDTDFKKNFQQGCKKRSVDFPKDVSTGGSKREAIPSTSNENDHDRSMINMQLCEPETDLEDDFNLSDSQLDSIENQTIPGPSTFNPTTQSSTSFNNSYFFKTNTGSFTPAMPSMKWIAQLKEDKRRLQAVVTEISQLNAMLTRATREIWPTRFKRT